MKLKKVLGVIVAIAMFATMATAASAYSAYLIGDINGWGLGFWGPGDEGNVSSGNGVNITGNGTYTVYIDWEEAIEGVEFITLVAEIPSTGGGAAAAFNDYPDANIAITSLKADGVEIAKTGNSFKAEEDGVMRVWVYNPWGPADNGTYVADDSVLEGASKIEVTFTVTGMGGDEAPIGNTEAPVTTTKDGADTGIAGVAVVSAVAIVAAGALAISRKRK